MNQEEAPKIRVDMMVFDRGERGQELIASFAKMASANLLETWESGGHAQPLEIPGLGSVPGHCFVRWEDMSAEEAIDNWVEDQVDPPGFAVILAYSNPPNEDVPLLAWGRAPSCRPHTVGDIQMDQLVDSLGVDRREVWKHPQLSCVALPLVLAHPQMEFLHESASEFRALEDARQLDLKTISAPTWRPGPRL